MAESQDKGNWQVAVANRAGCDESRVTEVLTARRIQLAPVAASPRRLLLKRIAFSGVKNGLPESGEFEFEWDGLDRGLWAMISDTNLKGKSSVIEVVRWLLRGRPSSNLQDDVKQWISRASLRFQLDEIFYEVQFSKTDDIKGNLVRLENDGKECPLASFIGENDFEAVMSDFFMREFSLDHITGWYSSAKEGEGKTVTHGWPLLAGVMLIGTDYSSLLGDVPPTSGLPIRLMQMYLGLPWISTLTAIKAIQKSVAQDQDTRDRRRKMRCAAQKNRVEFINAELNSMRAELDRTPSDMEIRAALAELSTELAKSKIEEHSALERLEREKSAVNSAEVAYADDRRELQAHLDAKSAGAVFRKLDPVFCPRCDVKISGERREREKNTHSCSVCGEHIASDCDSNDVQLDLESQVNASKAALAKARREHDKVINALQEIRHRGDILNSDIASLTEKLASFGTRNRIEMEVAMLEARLEEAKLDPEPDGVGDDDTEVLGAMTSETEDRVKSVQEDILCAVSKRIVEYARRFGMENLEDAKLAGNVHLQLVKGGERTSYSKVTDGEKLRLKVATVLAMISVAEARGIGRHPGLLMIDSPGAHEVVAKDLEALVAGLDEVSREFKHLQVFIAALATPAIMKHVPQKRMLYAQEDAPLW